jgi:hypothetical protein
MTAWKKRTIPVPAARQAAAIDAEGRRPIIVSL